MKWLEHVNLNVTKEIEEYTKREVLATGEFLVIRNDKKYGYIGYCTRCEKEFKVNDSNHNEYTHCPMCQARLTTKNSRYKRKSLINKALIYTFEKSLIDNDTLICKAYTTIRSDYTDYKNIKTKYYLEAVYVFNELESTMYYKGYNGELNKRSSIFDVNNILSGGFNWRREVYLDIKSFDKASKGTKFQYCMLNEVLKETSRNQIDILLKYLQVYIKNPLIESLVKIGFVKLIVGKLEGDSLYYTCNWRGKNIYKILKINRSELKEITKAKKQLNAAELKIFQIAKKHKSKMCLEEVSDIACKFGYRIFTLEKILQYVNIDKLMRYFKKQFSIKNGVYGNYGAVLITYSDYISDIKKLNLDLTNKRILFPKNLMQEHLRTEAEIKYKSDKLLSKKIMVRRESLNKYKFVADGFILRPVRSYKEIINEGKALGHCVASYAKKHAEGETGIFVLRKIEETNKPFYTVEIKNKQIIQVRGKANKPMSLEVEKFIEKFKIEKLKVKKKDNEVIKIA